MTDANLYRLHSISTNKAGLKITYASMEALIFDIQPQPPGPGWTKDKAMDAFIIDIQHQQPGPAWEKVKAMEAFVSDIQPQQLGPGWKKMT